MSPVLAIISRDLLGVHARVGEIEKGFGRWSLAIGGIGAIMAGGAIFGGMVKLAERGSEVNHQLELMKLQGMQVADIHEAAARAMQVSGSVLTSTYSENLQHIRELRYAFGDTPDALKYLEAVTMANATLNAMHGGGTDQVWELVKSLEEKGLTAKPEEFMSYIGQMTKAVVASSGKVTPAQFFSAFKYGRTAMLGWDEMFVTQYLPRSIQSWSGGGMNIGTGGPGNALMSVFQTVIGGHMTKAAANIWSNLKLATTEKIPGSSRVLTHVNEALKSAAIKNPYEFAQMLEPTIMEKTRGNKQKMIELLGQMFQNRTAGAIMTQYILQGRALLGDQSPYEKDARLQREAFDQRMSYDELIKHDYQTMMLAFHAQWKSLNQVLGAPLTQAGGPVVRALAGITHFMNVVSQIAQAHPEAIEIVADALAALAASLVIGGLVALGAAIWSVIGAGTILVALAAGLASFAALNWPAIQSAIEPFTSWLDSMDKSIAGWVKNHLPSGWAPSDQNGGGGGPYGGLDKQSSYIPPARSITVQPAKVAINLDGRTLGEAQVGFIARQGAGPVEGSPYHDSTYSTSPVDFALA